MPDINILKRLAIWFFGTLVVFITCAALFADLGKVTSLVSGISPTWLGAIMISVLFNYALRFWKWSFFLKLLNLSISLKDSAWIFFSAFTMVLSPGKLGEVVKSLLLKSRYGFPISQTAPIVMAERVTDLLGLLILAAIGSSRFTYGTRTLIVASIIMSAGVFTITRKAFWSALDRLIISRLQQLEKFRPALKALEESTGNLLSIRSLLFTTPLSAISWAGEGVALFFIFQSLGVEKEGLLGISLFAHAFSSIVGAFSFLPGGLLVTEGTLGVFFVFIGIGKDQSLSATFLIRALTLWFAVIIGTVIFLIGKRPDDLYEVQTKEKPS